MPAGRVFINYRREDSQAAAGRLYDRFLQHFDRDKVFMDVDGIAPGTDFVQTLERQVAQCDAFVAVIGPHWSTLKGKSGSRRIDDPNDYVRLELEAALQRDIRVIPVLVDGAAMPSAVDVPASLQGFVRRQAVEVSHSRFGSDVDGLATAVAQAIGVQPKKKRTANIDLAGDENPKSFIETLFGFRGRISRRTFWKSLALVYSVLLLLSAGLSAVLVTDIFTTSSDIDEVITRLTAMSSLSQPNRHMTLLSVLIAMPFYWPYIALLLKRAHDLNQGWWLAGPSVSVGLAGLVSWVAGFPMLTTGFYALYFGLVAIIGLMKGTPGDNDYGPDPLDAEK